MKFISPLTLLSDLMSFSFLVRSVGTGLALFLVPPPPSASTASSWSLSFLLSPSISLSILPTDKETMTNITHKNQCMMWVYFECTEFKRKRGDHLRPRRPCTLVMERRDIKYKGKILRADENNFSASPL